MPIVSKKSASRSAKISSRTPSTAPSPFAAKKAPNRKSAGLAKAMVSRLRSGSAQPENAGTLSIQPAAFSSVLPPMAKAAWTITASTVATAMAISIAPFTRRT